MPLKAWISQNRVSTRPFPSSDDAGGLPQHGSGLHG
jgi:hypothetical protein